MVMMITIFTLIIIHHHHLQVTFVMLAPELAGNDALLGFQELSASDIMSHYHKIAIIYDVIYLLSI